MDACELAIGHSVRVFVLAIGGSASVGKTSLAALIAERLRLEHIVHVDDLAARPEHSIGRSFLDDAPDVWDEPAPWLRESLIAWTRQLHPVIAAEIDRLVAGGESGVIEGEGIEPRLFGPCSTLPVRPVYVIEDDPDRLRETLARRSSGARFLALSDSQQRAVVEMNRSYGAWLRGEAEHYGHAWVSARPWETLPDRVIAATAME
jgi:hypothetical protein